MSQKGEFLCIGAGLAALTASYLLTQRGWPGLLGTAVQMAAMHPNQVLYFNFLVDKSTPPVLQCQYLLLPDKLLASFSRQPN